MPSALETTGTTTVTPEPFAAGPREAVPRFDYDVECDWNLLSTCNYRCAYCFHSPETLGSKLEVFATPDEWGAAFDATGKRWLIHMTGGEPTVYPEFLELCETLTRRHCISINTNLSRPVIRKLAGRVDPFRVSFINAGLHVLERLNRKGLKTYLANARYMQDAGFRVLVSSVAEPRVLADFASLVRLCASHGLRLAPKVYRGIYSGKRYPNSYSPQEKAMLRAAIVKAHNYYAEKFPGWPRPSIDVLSDEDLLDGIPDFRGRPCSAGQRFVGLTANGDVFRCNSDRPSIGNLLRGTVRFTTGPKACDTDYCVYFCKKYTADAMQHVPRVTDRPGLT